MPALFSGFSGDSTSAGLSVMMILAKATLVLVAAMGVTKLMERGSAISRHLVWFVSLGALLLIPALASWSPLRFAILPAADAISSDVVVPATRGPALPSIVSPSVAPAVDAPNTLAPPNVEATVNTVRNIVSPKMQWFGIL